LNQWQEAFVTDRDDHGDDLAVPLDLARDAVFAHGLDGSHRVAVRLDLYVDCLRRHHDHTSWSV